MLFCWNDVKYIDVGLENLHTFCSMTAVIFHVSDVFSSFQIFKTDPQMKVKTRFCTKLLPFIVACVFA